MPFLIFLGLNKNCLLFKASLIVITGFKSLYVILAFNTAFLASSVVVAATANNGWPKNSTFFSGKIGSP